MIDSRRIEDLLPVVQERARVFLKAAQQDGITLLVTSTYRDHECQDALYRKGRSVAGIACRCGGETNAAGECQKHPFGYPVTNARAGESYHNHRCALDIVPMVFGKPVWDTELPQNKDLWRRIGRHAEAAGLEWAGRWMGRLKEFAHVQYTGGLNLKDLQDGKTPT